MIKKIDRHIVMAMASSTLVVLFALLSIDILGKMIAEVDILGKKNYTILNFMAYVFGISPLQLLRFFPMALLIGALMGLGKLSSTSELTVMQTSGVSRLRIAMIGLVFAIFSGSCVLLISEYIGVPLKEKVTQMRAEALGKITSGVNSKGAWAHDGNSFIHIGGVLANGELANLAIYTLDENRAISQIVTAKSALFEPNSWLLKEVTEKTLLPLRIETNQYKEKVWKNSLANDVIRLLLLSPEDLSISDLYTYIAYQEANNIKPTNYALVFWKRLFLPLSVGVMFLLALPFVFGSQRNSSQGKKLFIGILFGLAYFVVSASISNIILLTGAPVVLGAIIPIVLFAGISFGLLWWRS